jgi:hypothetical protein
MKWCPGNFGEKLTTATNFRDPFRFREKSLHFWHVSPYLGGWQLSLFIGLRLPQTELENFLHRRGSAQLQEFLL